jgi:hypothetical protein
VAVNLVVVFGGDGGELIAHWFWWGCLWWGCVSLSLLSLLSLLPGYMERAHIHHLINDWR